jgi:hypothetical protein
MAFLFLLLCFSVFLQFFLLPFLLLCFLLYAFICFS